MAIPLTVLLARIIDGYHADPEPVEVSGAETILATRAPGHGNGSHILLLRLQAHGASEIPSTPEQVKIRKSRRNVDRVGETDGP